MSKIKKFLLGEHPIEYLKSPFTKIYWKNKWKQFPYNIKRYWVFILGMAILAFLDVATTKAGLTLGFTEKNEFMESLMNNHGFSLMAWASSLGKMAILFIFIFLNRRIVLHVSTLFVLVVVILNFHTIALTLSGLLSPY